MIWFVLFAATVFALYFWREYRIQQRDLESSTAPHRGGQRYIGQVLMLTSGIKEGEGRAELGGRRWNLRGPDVPAGGKVRVTGVDGSVLIVDRLPT
jgi:membrane protein implicated in regulation of membrane protease activity